MTSHGVIVVVIALCAPTQAHGQPATVQESRVDARAEVAAALYAASATQAAAQRASDAKLRTLRDEIESLRVELRTQTAGHAQQRAALVAAQERYVADLAARDRAYAQEIAVLRGAVEDIAATPEGAGALARFNAGDEVGALSILDQLRAARDAARKRRADIESAAEGRRIATLAVDARAKGRVPTSQVIERYEEVTRLDPGVHWDWAMLNRLYRDAGRLQDAQRAAQRAVETADDDADRSVALSEVGDVQLMQGDRAGALASYRESLALVERLAQSEPTNGNWFRHMTTANFRIGQVLLMENDRAGALASYRAGLNIAEQLAKADPSNTVWQRDLSNLHRNIGDVLLADGDRSGALVSYRAGHAIDERLVQSDSSRAMWQNDLSTSHTKIGDALRAAGDRAGAMESYRAGLSIRERLAETDPGNTEWQHDLVSSNARVGDMQLAEGDRAGGLASYRTALTILEQLAQADSSNAMWQRDLIVMLGKLTEITRDLTYAERALDVALSMERRGLLAPTDAWMIPRLKKLLAQ